MSDSLTERAWTNLKDEAALSSLGAFAKSRKNAHNLRELERSLSRIEAFSRTRLARKKFPRPAYILHKAYYIWCSDLVEMENKNSNDGNRFILVLIDQFSKRAALQAMRKKSKEMTKLALEQAVKRLSNGYKRTPTYLLTDGGGEYSNRLVNGFLKKHGIQHRVLITGMKASVCERFNKTLEIWLYKYLTLNRTKRWLDVLPMFETFYNNKKHSTTLVPPSKVSDANADEVFRNSYRHLIKKLPRKPPVYKLGDTVRILEKQNIFQKKYKPLFSKTIYKVSKIIDSFPVFSYRVSTRSGDEVDKTFVSQELSPATVD